MKVYHVLGVWDAKKAGFPAKWKRVKIEAILVAPAARNPEQLAKMITPSACPEEEPMLFERKSIGEAYNSIAEGVVLLSCTPST